MASVVISKLHDIEIGDVVQDVRGNDVYGKVIRKGMNRVNGKYVDTVTISVIRDGTKLIVPVEFVKHITGNYKTKNTIVIDWLALRDAVTMLYDHCIAETATDEIIDNAFEAIEDALEVQDLSFLVEMLENFENASSIEELAHWAGVALDGIDERIRSTKSVPEGTWVKSYRPVKEYGADHVLGAISEELKALSRHFTGIEDRGVNYPNEAGNMLRTFVMELEEEVSPAINNILDRIDGFGIKLSKMRGGTSSLRVHARTCEELLSDLREAA